MNPPTTSTVRGNAIYPTADTARRTLSALYATPMYRGSRDETPLYAPFSGRQDCDECAARQHEAAGQLAEGVGLRARAHCRRSFAQDGPETSLLLCREHEQLWHERDTADGVRGR